MAGEKRGKCVEALTIVSLQKTLSSDFVVLAWDESRRPLLWKPDLLATIRDSKKFFLITYSGSETHSKEKFWRNLAETIDAKLRLGTNLAAIAINYKARMRAKLAMATRKLLDGYVEITDADVADVPLALANQVSAAGREDKLLLIEQEHWDTLTKDAQQMLCNSINDAISNSINQAIVPLYSLLAKHRSSLACQPARDLSIHDAVVKLSILTDSDFNSALHKRLKVKEGSPNLALYKRAGVCEGVANRLPQDVTQAIDILGSNVLRDVVANGITPTGKSALSLLRQIPSLAAQATYVQDHLNSLVTTNGMSKALTQCFCDPVKMIRPYDESYIPGAGNWLFTFIKNLLAAAYSRQGQEWIEDVGRLSDQMRSILVGLHFPKFERCEEPLSNRVHQALSSVFASRLMTCRDRVSVLIDKTVNEIVDANLGNRLAAHGYQTVWYLVKRELDRMGLKYSDELVQSSVSEFCLLDKKTGSTRFIRQGDTLIHCKLLTKDGRDHKVKELFARSALTIAKFGPDDKWTKRAGVKRLILVLDGEVRDGDLQILGNAWWDQILFVDQLERLGKLLD